MTFSRFAWTALLVCALVAAPVRSTSATGVPIDGFLPQVGVSLTREFIDDFTFAPEPSTTMTAPQLGLGGVPRYEVALLDTGAAVSLLTDASRVAFGIDEDYSGPGGDDGFTGFYKVTLGGATGFVDGDVLDPLGLYAIGLQAPRTDGATLGLNSVAMKGQTNTSMVAVPDYSDLPNVVGLSFISQYATRIRSDLPQIFTLAGQTVRTPAIEFFPRGSGGMGITRKAALLLNGESPVTPQHLPDLVNLDIDQPWEDPFAPTFISGGLFINVNVEDDLSGDGGLLSNSPFFLDTGASVTVVSVANALSLGFDVSQDEPEFTLAIVGSGGIQLDVPGFFADKFTIPAIGGSVVATHVPIIILDIADPSDPDNVVGGFIGTNLLAGRNLVIDPNPASAGGPSAGLYMSDPVTTNSNWTATSAAGSWGTGSNWSALASPDVKTIVNIRHVSGNSQTATLSANAMAWEVNVSGAGANKTMTLAVQSGVTLTTFAGFNIESHGVVALAGALDVQYVDIRNGGRLTGSGSIATGSGEIPGQVENASGFVAPGTGLGVLSIEGRFANGAGGTVEIELGGLTAGSQYDRIAVDGIASLDGTLAVTLAGGFVPTLGNAFSILTADEIGGEFAAVSLPTLVGNIVWHLGYDETALTLKVVYPGDFDADGNVDGDDLAEWEAGYGTTYTGADLLAWQRNVGLGGPGAAAVPEPAACGLAILAASVGMLWRRRPSRS